MTHSYFNKILRVDLSDGHTSIDEPGDIYFRRYMGGWNIIADILIHEVPAGADPLGAENKLVFAPGVLTGLPVAGAARNAIGAKSPLTGAWGASEVGGFWGTELKHAGFDALVVKGVSPNPVYLWIRDGAAELHDASQLWGKDTKETQEMIRQELGDKRVQCAMIGPGGENQVRFANIMNGLSDAAGRSGLGAVMGSKNLKAIAVRGTLKMKGADPEQIGELARAKAKLLRNIPWYATGTGIGLASMVATGNLPIRNFRDGEFEGAANISAENLLKEMSVGREGCYACSARCKKVVRFEEPYWVDPAYGGPEYETIAALGSCCGVDDIAAVARAGQLCNAYSLDTISTGVTIALAMECFEGNILTLSDTDGIDLRFGNAEAVVKMVEKIARREGLGAILAEGPGEAARRIGGGAEGYAMHVKNQAYPMHEPRLKRGLAISYSVSPTGPDHIHALQDTSLAHADEDGFLLSEPWYGQTLRSMGVLEPVALESLGPEKVRATAYSMMNYAMSNCLLTCVFVLWGLKQRVELVAAATGWDVGAFELLKVGERALTLARVFNVREGLGVHDDRLPERSLGPTRGGPLANGGIDREALEQAIRTYYGMMGWDRETGIPLPDKLHELGVSWAVEFLPEK